MLNSEKFKTANKRAEAFREHCNHTDCRKCELHSVCDDPRIVSAFHWLDLEAPAEEPLPCPFCGGIEHLLRETNGSRSWLVHCYVCGYRSQSCSSEEFAIAAHNRVARAANGGDK